MNRRSFLKLIPAIPVGVAASTVAKPNYLEMFKAIELKRREREDRVRQIHRAWAEFVFLNRPIPKHLISQ